MKYFVMASCAVISIFTISFGIYILSNFQTITDQIGGIIIVGFGFLAFCISSGFIGLYSGE